MINGKNEKEIEIKKLEIERAKVLGGILVADIRGTLTLVLNFKKYNSTISLFLIGLGILSSLGLIFSIILIALKIKKDVET